MAANNFEVGFVRRFDVSDIDKVVEIANNSLTEYYTSSLILDLFRSWPSSFLVFALEGKIVGLIVGSRHTATEARILLLAVDKDFRNRGIGKQLMDSFVRACIAERMMSIRLEVRTDNQEAIRFYKNYGFVITSTIRAYYSDSSDAYLMWKMI